MITRFQTKTVQNPTRWGGTYLYGLYKGVPRAVNLLQLRNTLYSPTPQKYFDT